MLAELTLLQNMIKSICIPGKKAVIYIFILTLLVTLFLVLEQRQPSGNDFTAVPQKNTSFKAEKSYAGMERVDYFLQPQSNLTPDQSNLPSLLYLAMIQDKRSYGIDRTFADWMALLMGQGYPRARLAILISSKDEYHQIQRYIELHPLIPFRQVTILLEPSTSGPDRENR